MLGILRFGFVPFRVELWDGGIRGLEFWSPARNGKILVYNSRGASVGNSHNHLPLALSPFCNRSVLCAVWGSAKQ